MRPPNHSDRDPYWDPPGELFCEDCETRCTPGERPCLCCVVEALEALEQEREMADGAAA